MLGTEESGSRSRDTRRTSGLKVTRTCEKGGGLERLGQEALGEREFVAEKNVGKSVLKKEAFGVQNTRSGRNCYNLEAMAHSTAASRSRLQKQ